jgi:hypothetical protein
MFPASPGFGNTTGNKLQNSTPLRMSGGGAMLRNNPQVGKAALS